MTTGTPTMRGEYCEFTFSDGSRCVFGARHRVRYHHSETGLDHWYGPDDAPRVEAARARVIAWASLYAQTRDEPGDRLSCSYEHTPLLLSDLRVLVESALPWPERCCTQCGNGDLYPRRCSQCGQRWADRACGPTHAVIAEELGLNDLRREAVRLQDLRIGLAELLGYSSDVAEHMADNVLLETAAMVIRGVRS